MEIEKGSVSSSYQVTQLNRYETSYKKLLKNHYRRNKASKAEFEQTIKDYVNNLKENPFQISHKEPFPGDTSQIGLKFRKKRWRRLPGLQGAARFGRLLFVVSEPTKIIYLVWIYTHAEFQEPNSRPPEKELIAEVNCIKQELSTEMDTA